MVHALIATVYFTQRPSESQSPSRKKKRGGIMQRQHCVGGILPGVWLWVLFRMAL